MFVSFKEITCWVLDKETIVCNWSLHRGRFTVAIIAGEDYKAEKKEEVCIDWEEMKAYDVGDGMSVYCWEG